MVFVLEIFAYSFSYALCSQEGNALRKHCFLFQILFGSPKTIFILLKTVKHSFSHGCCFEHCNAFLKPWDFVLKIVTLPLMAVATKRITNQCHGMTQGTRVIMMAGLW